MATSSLHLIDGVPAMPQPNDPGLRIAPIAAQRQALLTEPLPDGRFAFVFTPKHGSVIRRDLDRHHGAASDCCFRQQLPPPSEQLVAVHIMAARHGRDRRPSMTETAYDACRLPVLRVDFRPAEPMKGHRPYFERESADFIRPGVRGRRE